MYLMEVFVVESQLDLNAATRLPLSGFQRPQVGWD